LLAIDATPAPRNDLLRPERLEATAATEGTLLAAQKPMSAIPQYVRDVMTHKVTTLERNESLRTADDVMRLGRIRHLPVVDTDGALAGIVSQRDLFHSGLVRALGYGSHAREHALDALVLKEAMKTEVITTTPDTLLTEAAKVMLERKIGCLVVLDANKIAGILTESDFVRLTAGA
jgi:CBS domain-containing membrane protein